MAATISNALERARRGGTKRRPASGELRRIETIAIEGFKSIRDQTISLGTLNVFIGANGSGKTALLEAIGVLGSAAYGRVDDMELMRRGVRPGVPRLYKSAFAGERIPRVIKWSAVSKAGAGYDVTLDNPQDSAATPWRFGTETLRFAGRRLITRAPRGGNIWDAQEKKTPFKPADPYLGIARTPPPFGLLPPQVVSLISVLSDFVIYDPQTSVLRGTMMDPLQRDPVGLQGGRLAEAIKVLLRPDGQLGKMPKEELFALIGWSKGIDVSAPTPELVSPSIPIAVEIVRFADRYMRDELNLLSAYDASEGALYVLFALALVFHPRAPHFFAIENIDHALHPRLARSLVRTLGEYAQSSAKQILLTTHNPLVLDGLNLANEEIRLFTVDRTEAGHTIVNRVLYTEALAKAQETGATLSQMWTSGLLGAVPDLG